MQCSAAVQHDTKLFCKPLEHSELSLNRSPIGQCTALFMVVSAVNLLLFLPLLLLLSHAPLCLGWLPLRQASGWAIHQSSNRAHILWHPSQMSCVWNMPLALRRVGLPSPRPTQWTSNKHSQAEQREGWQRGKIVWSLGTRMMEKGKGHEQNLLKPCRITMLYSSLFSAWISHQSIPLQRYWK